MKIIDEAINIIFPRSCAICGKDPSRKYGYALCDSCGAEFEAEKRKICVKCQRAAYACTCTPSVRYENARIKYIHIMAYDSEFSEKLMAALKRRNLMALRRFLADELSQRLIREIGFEAFDVTFSPRSPKSVKKYGFDQSMELAKLVSKRLGAHFLKICRHLDGTNEQKTLGLDERVLNSSVSYSAVKCAKLEHDTLVIVDDIVTSGSTVREMCRMADDLGAKIIIVLTIARTS